MADLIINPDLVFLVSGDFKTANAGVDLVAGKSVYNDSNNLYQLGDATDARTSLAITLNTAKAGQPVNVLDNGIIDLGVALVQGQLYCMTLLGGIDLVGNLVAGQYINVHGYANDSNQLVLARYYTSFPLV